MTTFPASSAEEELLGRVLANLADVRRRTAAYGAGDVHVVAVTKTFGPEAVRCASAAGLDTVGENFVEELIEKRRATRDVPVAWQFLGALQSNKIARVAEAADLLAAVARPKEVERIARVRPGAAVYVEVDFTDIAGRPGARPEDVATLVALGRARGLDVRGLMTVAPPDARGAEAAFAGVDRLCEELGLEVRSMGMSDDFELALGHGASELRLGRALFGPRDAEGRLA